MTKYGQWKIWNDGECPTGGVKCQVQLRDQSRFDAEISDAKKAWRWDHTGQDGDIIVYRKVIEPKRETVTLWTRDRWADDELFQASRTHQYNDDVRITYDRVDGVFDETILKAERMK